MSYSARVFRILIASPSDVSEEREIAVNTIQAWNDLNSSERQIVLLPLRWETHAAPEYGHRPQEVINRQVVDNCDLLVGIFWTRIDQLPDFVSDTPTASSGGLLSNLALFNDDNKDYYRDMAKHLVTESLYRPVRFWLKNTGGVGARDVYVDIRISSDDSEITARPFSELIAPQKYGTRYYFPYRLGKDDEIEELGGQKITKLELPALQPQREISPKAHIMIGATRSGTVAIEARIYADSLPEPALRTLSISWTVNEVRMNARDLLQKAQVGIDEKKAPPATKQGANDS